jgi:hypothetical protein
MHQVFEPQKLDARHFGCQGFLLLGSDLFLRESVYRQQLAAQFSTHSGSERIDPPNHEARDAQ